MSKPQYVCCLVTEYHDGKVDVEVMQRGNFHECTKAAKMHTQKGDHRVKRVFTSVISQWEFDNLNSTAITR